MLLCNIFSLVNYQKMRRREEAGNILTIKSIGLARIAPEAMHC